MTSLQDQLNMPLDELASKSSSNFVKKSFNNNNNNNNNNNSLQSRRLFVGNISYSTSWQDLKDHFKPMGNVVYSKVLSQPNNPSRSRGCGIVEFETVQEAQLALQQLQNSELDGRQLYLKFDEKDKELFGAKPGNNRQVNNRRMQEYQRKQTFKTPYDNNNQAKTTITTRAGPAVSLYVGNLPYSCDWRELKQIFAIYGVVKHADVIYDAQGNSRGFGIVEMTTKPQAHSAIDNLNGEFYKGRKLEVRYDLKS